MVCQLIEGLGIWTASEGTVKPIGGLSVNVDGDLSADNMLVGDACVLKWP